MATHKDMIECFNMTGVNPECLVGVELDAVTLSKINPKLFQYLVWKYRKKTNPDIKFDDVQEVDFNEIGEAIRDFFLKDTSTKDS